MVKGFVTIATGDERYYILARNLLRSYRDNCINPVRFALIADEENEYTKEFDDIIILENAACSWMDKIELLRVCPYDENIFIDADCLIYQDINFFWELFKEATDFSCFGQKLPLDSTEGWFTKAVTKKYSIHFITHLHGILYFIRPGKKIDQMYELCQEIISEYHSYTFRAFNNVLADEPVFALAMSVMNFYPEERKPEYYCFVPFADYIYTNYINRTVIFSNSKDGKVENCCIVHWGNKNTLRAQYKSESSKMNYYYKRSLAWNEKIIGHLWYRMNFFKFGCTISDKIYLAQRLLKWFIERVKIKFTNVFRGEDR